MTESKSEEPVELPWGQAPAGATSWQLVRQQGDKWERCAWYNKRTGVADREWSVELLSPEQILTRWGGGTYRLQWMGREAGKSKGLGKSRAFTFDGVPPRPVYPNAPAPGVVAADVAEAAAPPVPAAPEVSAAMRDFERVYALVFGSVNQLFGLQAQSFDQERQRMQAYHVQTLELVKSQNADGPIKEALRNILANQKQLAERLDELEEEDDAPADPAAAEGPRIVGASGQTLKLTAKLEAMLANALEKYGSEALEKLAEKALR